MVVLDAAYDPESGLIALEVRERLPQTQIFTVPQPAVGTDWTCTPSHVRRFRVRAIRATLATSAVAGSRVPVVQYVARDGTPLVDIVPAALTQVTGLTDTWSWFYNAPAAANASTFNTVPLSSFWLPEGSTVKVKTVALDVGDQWSGIGLAYEVDRSGTVHP